MPVMRNMRSHTETMPISMLHKGLHPLSTACESRMNGARILPLVRLKYSRRRGMQRWRHFHANIAVF